MSHVVQLSEDVLADLEDDFDDSIPNGLGVLPANLEGEGDGASDNGSASECEIELENDDEESDANALRRRDDQIAALVASGNDLRTIARVYYSKSFTEVLSKVRHYIGRYAAESTCLPQDQPGTACEDEYETILAANNLVPDISNDIVIIHKYVVDHWGPRLPELYSLVRNPLDYVRIVLALGNNLVPSRSLSDFLPAAVEMVVTVSLSTASSGATGRPISEGALARSTDGCNIALELDRARTDILGFIEQRMSVVSPNLSALVGTSVAARLMGAAGGLAALCRIPACNVLVLGQSKKFSAGLSNIGLLRHRGFVWECDFVARTSAEFRRMAARKLSAKVCLVARMDSSRGSTDGSYGRKLREDIIKLMEKATAPPPSKNVKALPVPDEGPKKRRGGRRARKTKELYAQTELSKAINRVQFGVPEEEVVSFDQMRGLGMVKSSNLGPQSQSLGASGIQTSVVGRSVRALDAKTKAKTSDKLRQKLKAIGGIGQTPGLATSTRGASISGTSTAAARAALGTSTSLAFTPFQGLEFADPKSQQTKVSNANDRWFGPKRMKLSNPEE